MKYIILVLFIFKSFSVSSCEIRKETKAEIKYDIVKCYSGGKVIFLKKVTSGSVSLYDGVVRIGYIKGTGYSFKSNADCLTVDSDSDYINGLVDFN